MPAYRRVQFDNRKFSFRMDGRRMDNAGRLSTSRRLAARDHQKEQNWKSGPLRRRIPVYLASGNAESTMQFAPQFIGRGGDEARFP